MKSTAVVTTSRSTRGCLKLFLVIRTGGRFLGLRVCITVTSDIIGRYMYKVKDTGHKECYIVDLSDTANPCSCHQPKWQKVPCIHVIRVLNWREEFWRVWEYVGKEYTLERVEETCDFLNDKEFHLLKWIHNMLPEMSKRTSFSRSYRMNNGRNSQRKPSDGEMLVTVQTLSYE